MSFVYNRVSDPVMLRKLENVEAENKELKNTVDENMAKLTYKINQLTASVQEVVKVPDNEFPEGDYLHPITYETGMSVEPGLFYTDGEDIWEAIKAGTPESFEDTEYFDIITVEGGDTNDLYPQTDPPGGRESLL